jgi:hypothetical protein
MKEIDLFERLARKRPQNTESISARDQRVEHAQRTLNWLLQHWDKDTIRAFDLRAYGPRPRSRKDVHSSAEILVKNGWLAVVPQPRHDAGVWRVIRRAVASPTVS